jgi:deoxyribose-phosphate aldolase
VIAAVPGRDSQWRQQTKESISRCLNSASACSTLIAMQDIASFIDHTLLRPEATARTIEQLCAEAREHKFHAVCVNGCWVQHACYCLEESGVKVATVVGFPLGAMDSDVKRYETEAAVDAGAQEIDLVLNMGRLKDSDARYVLRELRDVVEAADERPVKVVIEACLLTREEKLLACELIVESGARFVVTSTALDSAGATIEDVKLVREAVGPKFGIKASGGFRDAQTALAMTDAGATRLGTSNGITILGSLTTSGPARN